ncbi:conserved hypothetical protein [Histoplasma capsulatum G186AR]|uniref:Phospholipase/carboxylesterase/thioesterase domain-containing protein n=1 Tax=Ajellomyces capsulatus (strain G186AR / H82 / ATCC MYA-2454 / RMSCC 2432) TaxID=447093 RepID=C0P0Y6_AJECG|nr:uncharacterized protein HCBG_09066 [Histoplasma capsulatum G186AR]EEH02622.1 conserved hypothetical protein [Histoplasma capsulatum G186AR]QSS70932.1 hypothetical protein I7I50_01593 [Histoplasma capsulatum G186AR]
MPSKKKQPYPPLLIVPSVGSDRTHTVIVLHGRGSNANCFGPEFLKSANLPAQLPMVKFIFPTASKWRSTLFKKMPINQWFDIFSLEEPGERADLQIDGLCETGQFLRRLIESEASLLGEDGHRKIVLGGLSQGCAAGIFTLLGGGFGSHGDQALGAFFGMSGWLLFEKHVRAIFSSAPCGDEDDEAFSASGSFGGFEREGGEVESPPTHQALNYIRDILDLPPLSESPGEGLEPTPPEASLRHLQTPIFLGHGSADPKISVRHGERMSNFLSEHVRMDVTWKVYPEFGHWYKIPDEIDNILLFLKEKVDRGLGS